MPSDAIKPPRRRDALYEVRRACVLAIFRLAGWRFEGEAPAARKFVIIAAPHTSNWDFVFMFGAAYHFRIRLRWLGKASLFTGPFGWAPKLAGGIPVDRAKSNNVVAQLIEAFGAADYLVVAVPPEGTRAKARYWKTGFYNIAHGAAVPIALGFVDYARKASGIGAAMEPTGDYDADLAAIKKFYAGVTPKFAGRRAN